MDGKSLSLLTGQRLKELREQVGLSHGKLSKVLKDVYGIDISRDSLMNYEVSDEHHSKAYKNNGMRIEYLRCLADYYNVSCDYLLGLSDIKKANLNVREMCNLLGITEGAIEELIELDLEPPCSVPVKRVLSQLLEYPDGEFEDLLMLVDWIRHVRLVVSRKSQSSFDGKSFLREDLKIERNLEKNIKKSMHGYYEIVSGEEAILLLEYRLQERFMEIVKSITKPKTKEAADDGKHTKDARRKRDKL